MEILVNGEKRDVDAGKTVEQLLTDLALEPRATVVERNGEIVERAQFPQEKLAEGDRLELVRFVGGG